MKVILENFSQKHFFQNNLELGSSMRIFLWIAKSIEFFHMDVWKASSEDLFFFFINVVHSAHINSD